MCTALKRTQLRTDSVQLFDVPGILHCAEDAGMKGIEPGQNIFHAVGVKRDDRPDPAGRSPQQEPAQILTRIEIEVGGSLQIVQQ